MIEELLQPYLPPVLIIFIAAIPVFFCYLFADYARHCAAKWLKWRFLMPWMLAHGFVIAPKNVHDLDFVHADEVNRKAGKANHAPTS